ncbi:hypothetical protein [Pseudomonas sp. TNT3]|uniref:hypothetical protein n=1 Tax=Pseudomonas sp. TNT3 TaxID=2654097 RepID=UPI0013917162|nr:hypothetical protein [Pseudomonas sp. TNT3]KAI2693248.1 hypothetical protein GBC55_006895 [Pseudomonas sp. TNT3]
MSWEVVSCWIEHHPGLASWVQAVGSIAAILAAIWIASRDSRLRRRAEIEVKSHSIVRAKTVVGDAGRRVYSAIETVKKFIVTPDLMGSISADLNQTQQHLKEAMSSPGVDSEIYTLIFLARTAVEEVAQVMQMIEKKMDLEKRLVEQAEIALNQITAAYESLKIMSSLLRVSSS